MTKVLNNKPVKQVKATKDDQSLLAIEKLTTLNGSLVAKVQSLSSEIDSLKTRVDQVASRRGL